MPRKPRPRSETQLAPLLDLQGAITRARGRPAPTVDLTGYQRAPSADIPPLLVIPPAAGESPG